MNASRSRRDFLRRTAAAAAAAALTPAGVGAGGEDARPIEQAPTRAPLASGDPVRIGIIGVGGMGSAHASALARFGRDSGTVRVEAICDVCDPRAAAAKRSVDRIQSSDIPTYRHSEELLARRDLHGVLIAAPEHWHARLAEDAIVSGKDVYVEKPMTLNLKDALRLEKVVRRNPDAIVCVGTQFVYSPSYVAAETLIAEGAIGKPVWSQTSYCRNSKEGEWTYYKIDPEWVPGKTVDWRKWCKPLGQIPWNADVYARWRRYRKYSTGIIGDLLVHHMTPVVKALNVGWPVRVAAHGGHYIDKAMQNHDQVNITVDFEKDHTMVVAGSTCNELGVERVIRGHKANLFVGGRTAIIRPERIWADEIEEREIAPPPGPAMDDQEVMRRHWLECIRTRQQTRSDVGLGLKVMVIVDLATRSMWEGGTFQFDPESRRVSRV